MKDHRTVTRFSRRLRRKLAAETLERRCLLAGDAFSAWTHPLDPWDTNSDGQVTPRDALVVINELNQSGQDGVAETKAPPILGIGDGASAEPKHLDSNGDGITTSRDALAVINRLSELGASEWSASEWSASVGQAEPEEPGVGDRSNSIGLASDESESLSFRDDFSRASGTLNQTQASASFTLVASQPRVSVDLNSVEDETLAIVRVFNAQGEEIANSTATGQRERFVGFDFATAAAETYRITVEYADPDSPTNPEFNFVLSVFQYQPSRWLPSTSDEVTEVDAEGDVGDRIETSIRVPIRPNGSSFSQTLEQPGDVDVFEFVNALPGSIYVSGVDGITFKLLNVEAVAYVRTDLGVETNEQSDIGYYQNTQVIPSEYVYLKVYSTSDSVGQYDVSILFDAAANVREPSVLDDYVEQQAEEITFVDRVATISGSTDISDQKVFYRFSTDQERLIASIQGDQNVQMQLFLANRQSAYSEIMTSSATIELPGSYLQDQFEFILAVWNPRQAGSFEIDLQLIGRDTPSEDLIGDTIETAADLPARDETFRRTHAIIDLQSADDVDVYRFTAIHQQTSVILGPLRPSEESELMVDFDLLDGNGNIIQPDQSHWTDEMIMLFERTGIGMYVFDTTVDQEYFLRFENMADTINAARVLVR